MRRLRLHPAWLLLAAIAVAPVHADALTWYEWSSISPIVVSGVPTGEVGRYTAFRVDRSIRGGLPVGTQVLIDIREMNRSRNRELYRKAMRLALDTPYAVLLDPTAKRQSKEIVYAMVRGVKGARELPPEGAIAILDALGRFVEIQDSKSERSKWRELTRMLDEGNPILLENALDQFLKFRRGDPELSLSVVPLLDHPLAPLRARAAALIGQIVETFGADRLPEEQTLRGELFALARRDESTDVRLAACRAVARFPDRGVEEVLQEVAEKDPEQDVRYEAEKLLYQRRLDGERADRG